MTLIVIDPFMWIEPVAYLSERKVCACVKWVSVTSRLSCRVFNPPIHTSKLRNIRHSVKFGQIRLSDKFGLRLNFDLEPALFLIFYLNLQFRNFYYFLVKTCPHHNICHHHIHKNFFKISFLAERNNCKSHRRLQFRAKMNCQGCMQDIDLSGRTISIEWRW